MAARRQERDPAHELHFAPSLRPSTRPELDRPSALAGTWVCPDGHPGFALDMHVCSAPNCPCTDVELALFPRELLGRSSGEADDAVEPVAVQFDVRTREVRTVSDPAGRLAAPADEPGFEDSSPERSATALSRASIGCARVTIAAVFDDVVNALSELRGPSLTALLAVLPTVVNDDERARVAFALADLRIADPGVLAVIGVELPLDRGQDRVGDLDEIALVLARDQDALRAGFDGGLHTLGERERPQPGRYAADVH